MNKPKLYLVQVCLAHQKGSYNLPNKQNTDSETILVNFPQIVADGYGNLWLQNQGNQASKRSRYVMYLHHNYHHYVHGSL